MKVIGALATALLYLWLAFFGGAIALEGILNYGKTLPNPHLTFSFSVVLVRVIAGGATVLYSLCRLRRLYRYANPLRNDA